jgi:hypothetical protein
MMKSGDVASLRRTSFASTFLACRRLSAVTLQRLVNTILCRTTAPERLGGRALRTGTDLSERKKLGSVPNQLSVGCESPQDVVIDA